ncbi:heparinase II/III family protein [Dechloromonas sp. XY25]|uniref:Heparinase II/III family protein n=1 Tax=Dechloromonas hankyongensis TaxID=2908002 RepID=A0ABS9K627_9RHOO|nr:alginate lyase family protein [Dechloromonas hankyongensis]MCG2578613.1 heparinase II/III family protein [Dechloromonas hankyongensis]
MDGSSDQGPVPSPSGSIIKYPRLRQARRALPSLPGWLLWRLNRLRCMSPAEVGHRLLRRLESESERLGWRGQAVAPAPDLGRRGRPWLDLPPDTDPAPCLAAADRLVAGRFDIFALHDIDLGTPPAWNRDPKSGVEAPASFGKLLDYRDPRRVGDIKYLWEPNRHLHLVTLGQAWALSGETAYFETIVYHLESWFAECPPGRGPNWTSALEAALRLLNWSATWHLLGGAASPLFGPAAGAAFRRRWLDSVYHHAAFIRGYFSHDSSANNHLIGEAAGLFVAALTWPHWPAAAEWQGTARAVLEHEAVRQNAPDGVNREQSTAYQLFVLDLLLVPLLVGRAANIEFSSGYQDIIEKMLAFLASLMDVGGHLPMIGDADDGVVLGLSPGADPDARCRSLLATGAVLFGRSDLRTKAGVLDERTRWLLGPGAEARFAALPPLPPGQSSLPVRQAFPQGGYYILGCAFESPDEIRLVADAGPLGFGRLAAHGHADALSFTLSVGGREFLIDPGTYAYHTEAEWRHYFRGTAAHNTARVDDEDQSVPGGNFMWLRHANAQCSDWQSTPDKDICEGWHDGYRRLADPVVHQRRITLDKAARRIDIEDRFHMRGWHLVELFFHCSEQCRIEATADGYRLSIADRSLLLRLPSLPGSRLTLHRGSRSPILGWVSRRFDEKEPTTTFRWSAILNSNTYLCTRIEC